MARIYATISFAGFVVGLLIENADAVVVCLVMWAVAVLVGKANQ